MNRGSWKNMESEWGDALKQGKKVEVEITLEYQNTKRPDIFKVFYKIDGKTYIRRFKNL